MGLFKPAWKSNNMGKARKVLKNETNQSTIAEIANTAPSHDLRIAAVKKLTDQGALKNVATTNKYLDVRMVAAEKLNDKIIAQMVFAYIAEKSKDIELRIMAERNLTDQEILKSIAKNPDKDRLFRLSAAAKLTDKTLYNELLLNDIKNTSIDKHKRNWLIDSMTDQEMLKEIADSNDSSLYRFTCVGEAWDNSDRVDDSRNLPLPLVTYTLDLRDTARQRLALLKFWAK